MVQNGEREYIAFISYRHLPLQMEVAKAIHKRIEHYVIPRALRKEGKPKLGYVFRDQDELPIAGTLSENIQYALDHSEFLIVICTPETKESVWCVREITYFLEHHDRDHVLAVLADGFPQDAFPPQITEIRGENGELIDRSEPLAANIVSDSSAGRRKKLRTESLRILAALIGCPYDALYRREQRYRFRRLAAASAAGLCVAAVFVGMLLDRNARIRDQLRESQINESVALSALSRSAYLEGDYNGSIEYALQALPSETDERPYVAKAERALSRALPLYSGFALAYDQSFEQPTVIRKMEMSRDGRYIATIDAFDRIRVFDDRSGELLWEKQASDYLNFFYLDEIGAIFADTTMYRASDGETLWELESGYYIRFSPNQTWVVYEAYKEYDEYLFVADAATGEPHFDVSLEDMSFILRATGVSDDGQYAAVLDGDGILAVYDLAAETLSVIDSERTADISGSVRLEFLDNGDLMAAYTGDEEMGCGVAVYDREKGWECRFDTQVEIDRSALYRGGGFNMFTTLDVLDVSRDRIAFGSGKNLYLMDRETGEVVMDVLLPDFISSGTMYDNNTFGLILDNGLITMCTDNGILSYTAEMYYFDSRCGLYTAVLTGDRYGNSVFAIVTQANNNRISVLRWVENDYLTPATGDEPGIKDARLCASSSGETAAVYRFDTSNKVLFGEILDLKDGGSSTPFEIALDGYFSPASGDVFLTEDGKLLAQGRVFDLLTGEQYGMTKTGEFPDEYRTCFKAAVLPGEKAVYSAVMTKPGWNEASRLTLWRNEEFFRAVDLPEEFSSPDQTPVCVSFGSSGYLAVSLKADKDSAEDAGICCMAYSVEEDRWIELPDMSPSVETVCAVGDTESLLAAPGRDGGLQLVDLKTGEVCLDIPEEQQALCKLLFAMEDRVLLAFSSAGTVQVFDTRTGEQLGEEYFGAENLRFHSDPSYSAVLPAPGDRLLIICTDEHYSESTAVCLDTESWGCAGLYFGIEYYCADTNRLLVKPALEGFYFAPYFSMEDIVAQGRAILDRSETGSEE